MSAKAISDEGLKGLTNAVRQLGLIQPIIVRPAGGQRYQVIVGERRRLAALQAGETAVPVIVRTCSDEEALEIRVFENIGLGVRSALEPREMANAVQAIAARFASAEEAAQYFGRAPTWLAQATAAAKLSEKVSALLDSGKISSTGAAVQLENWPGKTRPKAESLIEQIAQLPDGERSRRKSSTTCSPGIRPPRKDEERAVPAQLMPEAAAPQATTDDVPPWEETPSQPSPAPLAPAAPAAKSIRQVKLVAELLGLSEEDEKPSLPG